MGLFTTAKKFFTSEPEALPSASANVDPVVDPIAENLRDRRAVIDALVDGAAYARAELEALESAHAKTIAANADAIAPVAQLVDEARAAVAAAHAAFVSDPSDRNAKAIDSTERDLRLAALRCDDAAKQAKSIEDSSAATVASARSHAAECDRQVVAAQDAIATIERELTDAKERHRASAAGLHERVDPVALRFLESFKATRKAWAEMIAEHATTSPRVARYHTMLACLEALADEGIMCDVDAINFAMSPSPEHTHAEIPMVQVLSEIIHRTHTSGRIGELASHLSAYRKKLARLRRTNDTDEAQLEEWRELADAEHDPLNQRGEALRRLGRHVEATNVPRGDR